MERLAEDRGIKKTENVLAFAWPFVKLQKFMWNWFSFPLSVWLVNQNARFSAFEGFIDFIKLDFSKVFFQIVKVNFEDYSPYNLRIIVQIQLIWLFRRLQRIDRFGDAYIPVCKKFKIPSPISLSSSGWRTPRFKAASFVEQIRDSCQTGEVDAGC